MKLQLFAVGKSILIIRKSSFKLQITNRKVTHMSISIIGIPAMRRRITSRSSRRRAVALMMRVGRGASGTLRPMRSGMPPLLQE